MSVLNRFGFGREEPPEEPGSDEPEVLYSLQYALQDLAVVFAIASAVYVFVVLTGLSDGLLAWAAAYPQLRITELFLYAIFISVGFAVFSLYRWIQLTTTAREHEQAKRELQRKRIALEQSNQELERFAYAASHDLREPLRMVHSYLSLLERDLDEEALDETALGYLEEAQDASRRMDRMIRGILDYARLDREDDTTGPVDADAALDRAVDNLALRFDETDVELRRDRLPWVDADEQQLATVFLNLLQNALVHGGEELSTVDIRGERDGDRAIITVSDDGPGIPPAKRGRIFEMFHQGAGSRTNAGAGLGLPLARRIVESHGGQLYVDGSLGEGAAFVLELPAADPARAASEGLGTAEA